MHFAAVDANHDGCCTGLFVNAFFLVRRKFYMQCKPLIYCLDFHISRKPRRDLSPEKLLSLSKHDEIKLKLKSPNKTRQFYYMYCLSKTFQPHVPPGHSCTIADIKTDLDPRSQMIK